MGVSVAASTSRVSKPPSRGKKAEIKFSDDDTKGSFITHAPSTLEIIDNIRSPSPDFDCDSMDDLIRAAPDSALDADTYAVAGNLAVDDMEEISSPPDVPQTSRKHSRLSPPGPEPTTKRMRRISDWQGDISQRRFGPVRSDSVQEVGVSSADIDWDCS